MTDLTHIQMTLARSIEDDNVGRLEVYVWPLPVEFASALSMAIKTATVSYLQSVGIGNGEATDVSQPGNRLLN